MSNEDLTPDSIKFLRDQIAEETLRNAAPQLLEALTIVMLFYSNNLRDDIKQKCNAAIAAARGE